MRGTRQHSNRVSVTLGCGARGLRSAKLAKNAGFLTENRVFGRKEASPQGLPLCELAQDLKEAVETLRLRVAIVVVVRTG